MKEYIIALKKLNINNKLILKMIKDFKIMDFIDLFNGNYLKLQFKYNLKLDKYDELFVNKALLKDSLDKANNIIKLSHDNDIKIALINSSKYPHNLKTIENPPAIIYYKGRGFYSKHKKSIACVGTRSMTSFGIKAVESLVPKLSSEGFTIISGLADGIDAISHYQSLKNNGTTIAVLAHGLDMIYPKSNELLAMEILNNNGILVSEYPVGVKPDRFRFIERNRITSGLAEATIVFEAKEKSGTMHTVNFAIEQNRPVFCPVPSTITPTTSILAKLINSNMAIPIPFRTSFEVIVLGLGYDIKDKDKKIKIKNAIVSDIINDSNINQDLISSRLNFDVRKQSNVEVDPVVYAKYREILQSKNITNKDLLNAFMLSVIDLYKD